jgi:hypothetical protein
MMRCTFLRRRRVQRCTNIGPSLEFEYEYALVCVTGPEVAKSRLLPGWQVSFVVTGNGDFV